MKITHIVTRLTLVASFLTLATAVRAQDAEYRIFWEAYPGEIRERLEISDHKFQKMWEAAGRKEGVLEALRLWKAGSTVTVAFRGGDDELCTRIAAMADRWTEHGNIRFSFRDDDGHIRRWSSDDTEFAADIRVAFHHPEKGYWSLVGNESSDPKLIKPGQASMNLEDFDKTHPEGWEATVLHEFGHALGFHHEHQHPLTPCDFRWEDDPGYKPTRNGDGSFISDAGGRRPGIRRILSGPPLNMSEKEIGDNFKQLSRTSSMYLTSVFDRDSIMKYDLRIWMFWEGKKSRCYTGGRNTTLSKQDKSLMTKAYPSDPEGIRKLEEAIREYKQRNPAARADGSEQAAGDFDGAWAIETQRSNGRVMPTKVLEGSKLEFTAQKRFAFSVGPLTTMSGTYQIDPKTEPKTMDMLPTSGALKDKKLLGIYRLESDRLFLCYSEPGEPRPSSFDAEPGSRATLMTFTRSKKTD